MLHSPQCSSRVRVFLRFVSSRQELSGMPIHRENIRWACSKRNTSRRETGQKIKNYPCICLLRYNRTHTHSLLRTRNVYRNSVVSIHISHLEYLWFRYRRIFCCTHFNFSVLSVIRPEKCNDSILKHVPQPTSKLSLSDWHWMNERTVNCDTILWHIVWHQVTYLRHMHDILGITVPCTCISVLSFHAKTLWVFHNTERGL
jgi:hypothetical protein